MVDRDGSQGIDFDAVGEIAVTLAPFAASARSGPVPTTPAAPAYQSYVAQAWPTKQTAPSPERLRANKNPA